MKKVIFFILALLIVNKVIGQWVIVDSTWVSFAIHYKPPCIFVSKNNSPRGILINCNNSSFVVSNNGLGNIWVGDIDSYGDTIFCAAGKIYFSTDNGTSWNMFVDTATNSIKLLVNNNFLYVANFVDYNNSNIKRYSLSTGAITYFNLPIQEFSVTSFYGYSNEIYAGVRTGTSLVDGYLFRSTDNGSTWQQVIHFQPTPPFGNGSTIDAITKVNDSLIIIAGSFGMKKSINNGASFSNVSAIWNGVVPHYLFNSFGILFLGCDYGAYISYDTTTTWQYFNDGFSASTVVYEIIKIENYLYATTNHGLWKRPWSDVTVIQQIAEKPNATVFPTYSSDKVNITLHENTFLKTEIILYDYLGKLVYSNTFQTNDIQLDVSKFKTGIYFMKIINNSFQKTVKIVVE